MLLPEDMIILINLTPAGTISALTLTLPEAADSAQGMKRRVFTTQTITTLTVNISGGGSIGGTPVTTLGSTVAVEWQFTGTTWVRIN